MEITQHAYDRARERLGLNKKSFKKMVERALISGRKVNTFKGTIKKYLDKLSITYKTSPVVYGEYILFFVGEKLITTYQLPSTLKKYLK